nr:hypothetical protein [uncultured Allomuricauda sp.]
MKLFPIIFISVISTIGFSQKTYEFDYWVEYKVTYYKDSVKIKNRPFREKDSTFKKILLTNSKQNHYLAIVTEVDSITYTLRFSDNDGVFMQFEILKKDLKSSDYLNVECELISRYHNPFKYQTKNYDFVLMTDTTITNNSYQRYKLTSIKPKNQRKLKLGAEYYVIDMNTDFHLPILEFSTAYEEWKTTKKLPKGILFEKYFIDFYNHLDSKEVLVDYHKINKEILIDKDCVKLQNR